MVQGGGWAAPLWLAVTGCQVTPPPSPLPPPPSIHGIVASYVGDQIESIPPGCSRRRSRSPSDPGDRRGDSSCWATWRRKTVTIVGPDGKLYFDLLPGLDVWGLTLAQTKALIEKQYSQYVREPPRVTVILREVASRHVWILGRVQAPGVYPMTGPMTLLEAISLAGGTMSLTSYRDQEAAGVGEELADLKRSFVVRQGKFLPVDFARLLLEGDLSQNIYLQPDDFIYFPSAAARDVYVLGAVTEPRLVPYHDGLTVAGAVAGGYGTLKGAYLSHVAVVRGALSQPHLTVVDFRSVLHGEAADMSLQPGDIVYVPLSPYRYIDHYSGGDTGYVCQFRRDQWRHKPYSCACHWHARRFHPGGQRRPDHTARGASTHPLAAGGGFSPYHFEAKRININLNASY